MAVFFLNPRSIFIMLTCSGLALGSRYHPRIITTSPAMTELVFQLGHGDNLVAVSNFSNYPEEARTLPRIGMFFSTNIEMILRYVPDLILIDRIAYPSALGEPLKVMGIAQKEITIKTVDALFSNSSELAKQVFNESSSSIVKEMKQFFVSTIQNRPKKHFRYLIIAWTTPVTLVGHSTFLSDLLNQLGGTNLSPAHLNSPYPQVSLDWLVKNPPEVLFFLSSSQAEFAELKKETQKWWPTALVKTTILPADDFARTSFTPLRALPALLKELP